jgi:hypothetical protein
MENKVYSRTLASLPHRITSERSKQVFGTHKERALMKYPEELWILNSKESRLMGRTKHRRMDGVMEDLGK